MPLTKVLGALQTQLLVRKLITAGAMHVFGVWQIPLICKFGALQTQVLVSLLSANGTLHTAGV